METEREIAARKLKWIEGLLLFDLLGVFSLLYLLWLVAMRFFGEAGNPDRN